MIYHLDKIDDETRKILTATFPSYRGRTVKISTDIPSQLTSYWSGGSKNYYVFYELATGKVYQVEDNHPYFQAHKPRDLDRLRSGIIIVQHSIFMGKDAGITIFANACDVAPMLPEKIELNEDEKIVLEFTRSYKSSYAGIKNYRFHEAKSQKGITLVRWEEAKASLIGKKLLNKRGAITAAGRNAL